MSKDQNSIGRLKMPFPGLPARWKLGLSLLKLKVTPPHTVRFYLVRGRIMLSLGQNEQAARDFQTALRLDWRNVQASYWLNKAKYSNPQTREVGSFT